MRMSPVNPQSIRNLIASALTEQIDDREMFMKGIDYSYYYEQND
jgi:cell filamentation protein